MSRCVEKSSGQRRQSGLTLIEVVVATAIIASLATVTIPAVKGLLQTSQLAQAENLLRASLYSARTYAVQQSVVAGVRFQDDGHMVQIYARNHGRTYTREDFTRIPVYDMRAVEGVEPERLPGPWRATVRDVGHCDTASGLSGDMLATWIGGTASGASAAREWLHGEHPWFVFPVAVFSPQGRVILPDLVFHYSTDPAVGWYRTMDGSFGALTDREINLNTSPSTALRYTNQVAAVGWRGSGSQSAASRNCGSGCGGSCVKTDYASNCYNPCGGKSAKSGYNVPVLTPTVSAQLRLFDYAQFQGTARKEMALLGILSSASDCILNVNTGLPVRARAHQQTAANTQRDAN